MLPKVGGVVVGAIFIKDILTWHLQAQHSTETEENVSAELGLNNSNKSILSEF